MRRRAVLVAIGFVASVAAVHAAIIIFHVVMCSNSATGDAAKDLYYSGNGRKYYWPFFDYILPLFVLIPITLAFLHKAPMWAFLAGVVLAFGSIAALMPIYSTKMVPKPVRGWESVQPRPFDSLPAEKCSKSIPFALFAVACRLTYDKERKERAQ